MAEFLTTAEINARLEKIIENAKKELVFISPYLKVHDRLKQLIEVRARSGVKVQSDYQQRLATIHIPSPFDGRGLGRG